MWHKIGFNDKTNTYSENRMKKLRENIGLNKKVQLGILKKKNNNKNFV